MAETLIDSSPVEKNNGATRRIEKNLSNSILKPGFFSLVTEPESGRSHILRQIHRYYRSAFAPEVGKDDTRQAASSSDVPDGKTMSALLDFSWRPFGYERSEDPFFALLTLRKQFHHSNSFHFFDAACSLYLFRTGQLTPERVRALFPFCRRGYIFTLFDSLHNGSESDFKQFEEIITEAFQNSHNQHTHLGNRRHDQLVELINAEPHAIVQGLVQLFALELEAIQALSKGQFLILFDHCEQYALAKEAWQIVHAEEWDWLLDLSLVLQRQNVATLLAASSAPLDLASARNDASAAGMHQLLVKDICVDEALALFMPGETGNVQHAQGAPKATNSVILEGVLNDIAQIAAAKQLKSSPLKKGQEWKLEEAVNTLLRMLDRDVSSALVALASTRQFDCQAFYALAVNLNFREDYYCFALIRDLSFVFEEQRGGKSAYVIHATVRKLLTQTGKSQVVMAHQVLHRYYEKLSYAGDETCRIEALYHLSGFSWEMAAVAWIKECQVAHADLRPGYLLQLLRNRDVLYCESEYWVGRQLMQICTILESAQRWKEALHYYTQAINYFDVFINSKKAAGKGLLNKGICLYRVARILRIREKETVAIDIFDEALFVCNNYSLEVPETGPATVCKALILKELSSVFYTLEDRKKGEATFNKARTLLDECSHLQGYAQIIAVARAEMLLDIANFHKETQSAEETTSLLEQAIQLVKDAVDPTKSTVQLSAILASLYARKSYYLSQNGLTAEALQALKNALQNLGAGDGNGLPENDYGLLPFRIHVQAARLLSINDEFEAALKRVKAVKKMLVEYEKTAALTWQLHVVKGETYLLSGDLLLEAANFNEAKQDYEIANKCKLSLPEEVETKQAGNDDFKHLLEQRAWLFENLAEYENALSEWQKIEQILMEDDAQEGDYTAALELYVTCQHGIIRTLFATGRGERAEEVLRQLVDTLEADDVDKVLNDATRIMKASTLLKLADCFRTSEQTDLELADLAFQEGVRAIDQLLVANPRHGSAHTAKINYLIDRGEQFFHGGHIPDALQLARQAIQHMSSAKDIIAQSTGRNECQLRLHQFTGRCFARQGDYENAVTHYQLAYSAWEPSTGTKRFTIENQLKKASLLVDYGTLLERQSDYKHAVEVFKQARAAIDDAGTLQLPAHLLQSAKVDLKLGTIFTFIGKYEEANCYAVDALNTLVDMDSLPVERRLSQIEALVLLAMLPGSEARMDADENLRQAITYAKEIHETGAVEEAITMYGHIAFAKGDVNRRCGDLDTALDYFERSTKYFAKRSAGPEASFYRALGFRMQGEMLLSLGKDEQAVASLDDALSILDSMEDGSLLSFDASRQRSEIVLLLCTECLQGQCDDHALGLIITELENMLKGAPQHPYLNITYGQALAVRCAMEDEGESSSPESMNKALEAFESASAILGDSPAISYQKGKINIRLAEGLKSSGQVGQSVWYYKKALEFLLTCDESTANDVNLQRGEAYVGLASAQYMLSQAGEAIENYKHALEAYSVAEKTGKDICDIKYLMAFTNANLGDAYLEFGETHDAYMHLQAALEGYNNVIKHDSGYRNATMNAALTNLSLAHLAVNSGDSGQGLNFFKHAIHGFNKILKEMPQAEEALSNKAIALLQLGEHLSQLQHADEAETAYRQAITCYDKMLQSGADNIEAAYNKTLAISGIAAMQLMEGRFNEAKENYNNAIMMYDCILNLDSCHINSIFCKGSIFRVLGEIHLKLEQDSIANNYLENALEVFRRGLKLDDGNREIREAGIKTKEMLNQLRNS